jgi:hypothetical protein
MTEVKSCVMLALALSVVLIGPGKAATDNTELQDKTKTNVRIKRPTILQQRETWRKSMVRTARPGKGCFTTTYPEKTWKAVPCGKAPNRPYGPNIGIRPSTVGGGNDFSAQVTGNATAGEGSFDSVNGVINENDNGNANTFSLQLNTNRFTSNACNTFHATDAGCRAWEQFIYSNSGSAFIQYWLLPFAAAGTPCPAGWNAFNWPTPQQVSCFINSANAAAVPVQNITALGTMKLDGAVGDAVTLTIGNTLFAANGDNHFPDLTNGWRFSEFNVFGDFNSTQAVFNNGSTITVRTAVNSGMPATPPTCSQQGFTGETNNLTLVSAPVMVPDVVLPSVIFTESNNAPTPLSCDNADSIGDTHLKTFAGLLYDFQASGDFVLSQAGPDFVVQTRQVSGAPTWPNASINKAVATQMGKSRVALFIEPTRLVIDGAATDLADGKDLLLPTGVQVSRRGNLYAITSEDGNSVRAVDNGAWMDVHVGLGHSPQQPRGLLGGARNGRALMTSTGTILKQPVSFDNLYHSYAESWRVPREQSLFTEETTIKFGIPTKPFYASDLNRKEAAHALAACKAAGVKNLALLDACTVDTTVLNNGTAVQVFVHLSPPLHVIKPRVRRRDHDRDRDEHQVRTVIEPDRRAMPTSRESFCGQRCPRYTSADLLERNLARRRRIIGEWSEPAVVLPEAETRRATAPRSR